MADSFTENFGFDQPQVDASTNTWGTKTNLNWSSLDAILTQIAGTNIGAARPSPSFAGMFWINNTFPSTTQWTLYIYDGINDVAVGVINTVNNVFVPVAGAVGTTAVYFAQDTSTTPNTITASISTTPYPPISIGVMVIVKVANSVTGPTVISLDGSGPIAVVRSDSTSLQNNDIVANQTAILIFDGSHFQYFPPSPRRVLISNTTYYVNTGTGSDTTGNGSATTPWATIQKAVNFVQQKVDLGGYNVTISVTISGTYTQNTSITGPFIGVTSLNSVAIVGNPSNPAACPITVTGNDCFTGGYFSFFSVLGFQLSTVTSGYALNSNTGSVILFEYMIFGACASGHILANGCAAVFANGAYTIAGSAPFHWCAEVNGLLDCYNQTVTLTGAPAFSQAFAVCSGSATMTVNGNTFTGSATGQRYLISTNGTLFTGGAGEAYLPGNSAGLQKTGGRYDSDPLGIADGGTGATTLATAQANLGITNITGGSQQSVTATAGTTITAANFIGRLIARSGITANATDTTDTAANIVAAISNAQVGTILQINYQNNTAYTVTLAAGAGVTLSGNTAVYPNSTRIYWLLVTATGTPAVTLYGSAYGFNYVPATAGANSNITSLTGLTTALSAAQGGTGINNSNTITLGGNVNTGGALTTSGALSTSGSYAATLTFSGATNVTFPLTGTLLAGNTPYLPNGQCQFIYTSATVVTLTPWNGNNIVINGSVYGIPSGGVSATYNSCYVNGVAGQTLPASSLVYAYLFNNGGTLTLDFSTTAYVSDTTAGNVGIKVKNGASSRSLVGMAYTNPSSQFQSTLVRSYFNRTAAINYNAAEGSYTTTSGSNVELSTAIECPFLIWQDDSVQVVVNGSVTNNTAGSTNTGYVAFNTSTINLPNVSSHYDINYYYPLSHTIFWSAAQGSCAEGYNYATYYVHVSGGTGTWAYISVETIVGASR